MIHGQWILEKNHLSYWLRQKRKKMDLIAPMEKRGDIVFTSIEKIHKIALDCPALIPSPKEFLFPQLEPILSKATTGGEEEVADLRNESKRVVFGVRSCDVSAVALLDKFYLSGHGDPYYSARRKNTLFISIVCNVPDNTCFCNGLGTGPFLKSGFDIQLYDLGDRYFVECGSKSAMKWISPYSFLMRRPSKTDLEDQYEVELSSQAMFRKRINLKSAQQLIQSGTIGDEFWRSVSERCFECGGCVYECPVCTCYTVIDRKMKHDTERLRLWDTCLFKGFTRMAGGVLPAEDRILRTKRWFFHKLLHYPEVYGEYGCVGCGRCAVACPAAIDMATVVTRMKKNEK